MPNPNWKKGKSGNPKGCPKGAHHKGRPPKAFKEAARKAFWDAKTIDFYQSVVEGDDIPQKVNSEGELINIPASVADRMNAGDRLKEWAYGKSAQTIETEDGEAIVLPAVILLPAKTKGQAGGIEK